MHEIALIDRSLTIKFDDFPNRVPDTLFNDLPDDVEPRPDGARCRLVFSIVWFGGPEARRGWEREDVESCKEWASLVARYFVPLWREDWELKDRRFNGRTLDLVSEEVIRTLDDVDELKECAAACFMFWEYVLHRDFGIVSTPFYPSPNLSVNEYKCAAHRAPRG